MANAQQCDGSYLSATMVLSQNMTYEFDTDRYE